MMCRISVTLAGKSHPPLLPSSVHITFTISNHGNPGEVTGQDGEYCIRSTLNPPDDNALKGKKVFWSLHLFNIFLPIAAKNYIINLLFF